MQALLDLAGIYRTWNPKYNTWSVFGQDHVAKLLLNQDVSGSHDAVGDAIKSVRLFKLSEQLKLNPDAWEQAKVKDTTAVSTMFSLVHAICMKHAHSMVSAASTTVQPMCDHRDSFPAARQICRVQQ